MGVPISFNGNLAGHLGLGQHCNVNVMQPISRIIVGDGLIAAATICVNSVAAVIAMMDGYAVLQSGEFNQCPSVARMTLQTKKSNKRGSKKEHDRNEMDVCVPHLQEGVIHVLLKGGLQRCQLTQRPFCLHMASDLHAASAVFGPYKMSCLNISAHTHFVFLADSCRGMWYASTQQHIMHLMSSRLLFCLLHMQYGPRSRLSLIH